MAKRSNEAARFKTAGRGYARAEVEKAIAKYEQMLDEASRRIAQLEIDVEKTKESEAAAIDQAFFSLLEVKDRILGSAESRAQALLEEARDRAGAVDTHSGAKPSAEEHRLYRDVVLYWVYNRYEADFLARFPAGDPAP